jgi:prepilin-type N-terminal cleavage/methylation domain-containing protein
VASERNRKDEARSGGRRRGASGFTLMEMMVTVAIVAIVAALAYSSYARDRPRRRLSSTADEIQNALRSARQQALGSGRDVAVLFYPAQATGAGTGRVVVYFDGGGGFMAGAPPAGDPSFCTFDPATLATGPVTDRNRILNTIDLPNPVRMSIPADLVALNFPYNAVPAPLTGCSFCAAGISVPDATGVLRPVPGPGGIRFDARGRTTFYSTCGPPGPSTAGGSISLTAPGTSGVGGTYVLVVTPAGVVRTFNAG